MNRVRLLLIASGCTLDSTITQATKNINEMNKAQSCILASAALSGRYQWYKVPAHRPHWYAQFKFDKRKHRKSKGK